MNKSVKAIRLIPSERYETGCIATLTDGKRTVTRHFAGVGKAATRAVAMACDAEGLRVVSLSTPETIYRDLQGTRIELRPHVNNDHTRGVLNTPEKAMLGAIGRGDLLA